MIIYEEIFKEFQKQNIKYILVGGIAFNLLGGLRSTADLDILVEMSNENLTKIVDILSKNGYSVKQAVDPMKLADEKTRRTWTKAKHMKAFNFYKENEFKEVDIIIDSPVKYEDAKNDAVWIKEQGFNIPVVSIKNLIKMKKIANRAVDKLDVIILEEIKRSK